MLRMAVHALLLAVLALVALSLWVRATERSHVYFPARAIDETPAQHGLQYEDVWLTTPDGVKLNGWFLPSPHPTGWTILLLHGNAGNISHRLEKYALLLETGASVFALDYRGYGRSSGEPDETGTYVDAEAAYQYLTAQRHIAPQRIVVYGESLGSAVAVDLASHAKIGGLILEEAFTSAADVGQAMYPFLPMRWLLRTRYDSLSKIGRIQAPLLIFHSRDDEFFPLRHAERLLSAAPPPKQLVELHGGHNDAFLVSADLYRAALHRFLSALPAAAPSQ